MSSEKDGVTIAELHVENVKKVKVLQFTPQPTGAVVIGGENEAGKSSVLDSIAAAIGGNALCPEEPIRRGAKEGRVSVTLTAPGLVVERRFTRKGSYLTVKSAEGAAVKSPQALLDGLVGALTFDPLAFTKETPKQQVETLKRLAGLDFAVMDGKAAQAYAERTDFNRSLKMLQAEAAAITVADDIPAEAVSVHALLDELRKAQQINREMEAAHEAAATAQQLADQQERIVENARQTLKLAKERFTVLKEKAEDAMRRASALRPSPTEAIEARLRDAERINAGVKARERRTQLEAMAHEQEAAAAARTRIINEGSETKARAVADAHLPIEGLELTDDGVRYRGTLLGQCSQAEKLRVSVAMGIAMNPKLRVMLIHDGSLLDARNLETVGQMARDAGCQVWIERVGHGPEMAVVMEDGEVKGA